MEKFLWRPGDGFDDRAVERMRAHFLRPSQPMGEAWFMGSERYLYDYLSGDIERIPVGDLMKPLEEIVVGTNAFGYHDEWNSWYHYLLAQLIPRSHEYHVDYLLEYLISGFLTQYPDGVEEEPYNGFKEDVLNTLGKSMMDGVCWDGSSIVVGNILCPSNRNPARVWCWWDASGDFSASLLFCLKFLPAERISDWFQSALGIESPHWRAQLIVWLLGADKILRDEIKQPSEFGEGDRPSINWGIINKG